MRVARQASQHEAGATPMGPRRARFRGWQIAKQNISDEGRACVEVETGDRAAHAARLKRAAQLVVKLVLFQQPGPTRDGLAYSFLSAGRNALPEISQGGIEVGIAHRLPSRGRPLRHRRLE